MCVLVLYVYMYICIYKCKSLILCGQIPFWVFRMCECIYLYTLILNNQKGICLHSIKYLIIHIYICVCVCLYAYIHMHIYIYICVYICSCQSYMLLSSGLKISNFFAKTTLWEKRQIPVSVKSLQIISFG
jgi:hypothetical protein